MTGTLAADDLTGILALPPTPVREGVPLLGADSTVDLDEAERVADQLVVDGVSSIGLCGTTGECAALTWAERSELYATVVDIVAGRVPIFAGATALGTREVVSQVKALADLGVDGAFIGLPLWQTPTVASAVRFYADVGEACPDMPLMVYGNAFFFKFDYPPEFWEGVVATAPTVMACKVGFPLQDATRTALAGRVNFLRGETMMLDAWRADPEAIRGGWATSAAMGPEPWVAFFQALAEDDQGKAAKIADDISSVPTAVADRAMFASYNTQMEKARIDAAGYMRCGKARPPYTDFPDDWQHAADENARAWIELRARYRPL